MRTLVNLTNQWRNAFRILLNKKSVARKWLASYYLILLLPIIMGIIMYVYFIGLMKSETNRANDAVSAQVHNAVEARINDMDQLGNEMSKQSNISILRNSKVDMTADERVNLVEVAQNLDTYVQGRNYIDTIYLYFATNGTLLTRNDTVTKDDINKSAQGYNGLTSAQWGQMLSSRSFRSLYAFEDRSAAGSQAIYYVRNITLAGYKQSDLLAIFKMNPGALINNVQASELFKDSQLLLLDNSQHFTFSFGKKIKTGMSTAMLSNNEGLLKLKDPEGSYMVAYRTSPTFPNLKYVMMTGSDIFYQKTQWIQLLSIVSILICLFGGGFLSLYLINRNYSSIDSMLSFLSSRKKLASSSGRDEYSIIQDALMSVMQENDQTTHVILQQKKVLRSNYLDKLLKGLQVKGKHGQDTMQEFEIHLPGDTYGVILYSFDDYNMLGYSSVHPEHLPSLELLQFVVQNITEELANEYHIGYATTVDGMVACLMNFEYGTGEQQLQAMQQLSARTREILKLKFKTELSVTISGLHSGFAQIPTCYQETLEALEYRIVTGKSTVIEYNQISNQDKLGLSYSYYFPVFVEQQLMNCIQVKDDPSIRSILDDVFLRNAGDGLGSVSIARCLSYNLIGTIIRAVTEVAGERGSDFVDSLIASRPLSRLQDLEGMKQESFVLMNMASEFIQSMKETSHSKLIHDIKQYIQGSYTNPNLTIAMLGERFELSPYYISGIFKNETGQGLIDYIASQRMEHAKELLMTTEQSVQDIAVLVGFSEVGGFIRTFKKFESVPPGKYRKAKRESGETIGEF